MTAQSLKKFRQRLSLTQTELGEKLGMTRNAITLMEMGVRPILPRTVLALETIEREMEMETVGRKAGSRKK
jgi:DNA-binding XRE family transcriptional regulator